MKIKDRARPKTPPVEPGVYLAVCIGVIDLGEQYSEKFKYYANKVKIIWELPGVTVEVDGKREPRQLSREFTFSTSKKSTLRAYLSSWNNRTYTDKEFGELDLFDQIGQPCQLQVTLNETKEYSNVENLMALPKGVPVPTSTTAPIKWSMDDWDDVVFQTLPQWAQEQIKKSTQYQTSHASTEAITVQPEGQTEGAPF